MWLLLHAGVQHCPRNPNKPRPSPQAPALAGASFHWWHTPHVLQALMHLHTPQQHTSPSQWGPYLDQNLNNSHLAHNNGMHAHSVEHVHR